MRFATIFIMFLGLGAASNSLPRTEGSLITVLQNAAATAGDSKTPGPPQASAGSPSQQADSQQSSPTTTAIKTPASSHKKKRSKKPKSKPSKVIVRNGSIADPSTEFSTSMSPEQAMHEREITAGLLATTNSNLQKASGRPLNANQQDMLRQIRSYMEQAKSADEAGDLESARNLALKAELLSNELIRQ